MNAQQLKNAILQEAIQGRLVPQDPNDEPASVLLDRIRKEKAKLVKEGKLKKKDLEEKPIREDEKPFEIPERWKWCRVLDIGITETGTTPTKIHPEYYGDYIAFLSPANILNNTIVSETQGLSELGIKFGRVVPKNTILQVCIGGSIGKCAISHKAVTFNQQINSITPILCQVKYIHFVLQSRFFLLSIIDKATGTATPIINRSNWEQLLLPLPPLAEQQRIVAKIEELLPKVEEYGKAQDALDKLNKELPERLKKSILQEAIQGRLVPQDPNDEPASVLLDRIRKEKAKLIKEGKLKKKDLEEKPISEEEIPFEIPESWEWVRIRTIFSLQAGKNVTSDAINSEQDNIFKYPCFGGNGLRGYVKEYNTQGIYPLIGRQGALCGNVNIAHGKFWATEHAVVTDGYGMTSYKWQYFFLKALNLNQFATATAQPGLAVSTIIEVPIPLPPLAEQQRIVAKIEELFQEIDKLK